MTLPESRVKFKFSKLATKNVSCHLCDVRFTQRKALYVHLRNKHNIEPLEKKQGTVQCPECKNMFYDKYNLRRHCRRAHGTSPVCQGKILFLRGRIVDTNRKPKFILEIEKTWKTNDRTYKNQKAKATHENESNEFVICAICYNKFSTKTILIRHIGDVHARWQNLQCSECNEKFHDKRTLLHHTHSITKYCSLKEILPDTQIYKYEVAQYVQVNETNFVTEIYCSLVSREDANTWLDKFQRKNKVTFRKMRRQCQSSDKSYVFIIDRYRCQHNTLPKRRSTPHAKHTGCSATLFIRVYQHKHTPELSWSRIRIKHTHNHLTDAAAKFRDPIDEVVNKFRSMFQAGKGPKAALNEHIKDLQLLYGDDIFVDRGICPTSRWVYNFYHKMTKQRFEAVPNSSKTICNEGNVDILKKSLPYTEIPASVEVGSNGNIQEGYMLHEKIISPSKSSFSSFCNIQTRSFIQDVRQLGVGNIHRSSTSMNKTDVGIFGSLDDFEKRDETSFVNNLKFTTSTSKLESSLQMFHLNQMNLTTNAENSQTEYPRFRKCCVPSQHTNSSNTNFLNTSRVNVLPEIQIQDKSEKCLSEHKKCALHLLKSFDNVIAEIRSRISTDPMLFVNGMQNFVDTYSTLRTVASLNSALCSFGKYSNFQLSEL